RSQTRSCARRLGLVDAPPNRVDVATLQGKRDQGVFWTVIDAPISRFAESIRAIKIAADLNGSVNGSKVLAFTASLPNEGTSTAAMALAQSIANVGGRVVVLDAALNSEACVIPVW